MAIHQVSGDRIAKLRDTQQSLKQGQIVRGEILKLYPNNKAQIQLGSQLMIAQLEAPLSVGAKYHFQVQAADDVIHLKVLGEQLRKHADVNVTDLMQHLGLRVNKVNISLVQQLINEKVPFERDHLIRAFSLLESVKNKPQAQQILKEMIEQRLPINHSIFQALFTKETTGLSDQMKALLHQLRGHENPTSLQQNLVDRLSQMVELPLTNNNAIIKEIIEEVTANKQLIYNALKLSGVFNNQVDFSTWKAEWKVFFNQHNITQLNDSIQQVSTLIMPFSIEIESMELALKQMKIVQFDLRTESQTIASKWANRINESVLKSSSLSIEDFEQFKQEINLKLMPLLPSNQRLEITNNLQNNPVQLRLLLTVLQAYANEQINAKVDQLLTTINQQDLLSFVPPKDQFLAQLRQTLLFTGLAHENILAQEVTQQVTQQESASVKSMLIQMIQQGDMAGNDRAQQLLHFINGLQLQSIHETSNFIQASIQIPGERLALNNDLYLDFESQKTEDGTINPNYCRIIFYLDLVNLKETIIDMQIQKRLVSITIFNDQENIKQQSALLQPMLKKGLKSLNYHLSNVLIKPLREMNSFQKKATSQTYQDSYEGIDYRV